MSSKPTTETSSGTRRPASRSAWIAPIAEISLNAKSAVKGMPAARVPTNFGVRAERLPFDERDFLMTKLGQMVESQPRCVIVIQRDVGDARQFAVTRNRDNRDRHSALACRIDGDQPFDRALLQ